MEGGKVEINFVFVELLYFNINNFKMFLMIKVYILWDFLEFNGEFCYYVVYFDFK